MAIQWTRSAAWHGIRTGRDVSFREGQRARGLGNSNARRLRAGAENRSLNKTQITAGYTSDMQGGSMQPRVTCPVHHYIATRGGITRHDCDIQVPQHARRHLHPAMHSMCCRSRCQRARRSNAEAVATARVPGQCSQRPDLLWLHRQSQEVNLRRGGASSKLTQCEIPNETATPMREFKNMKGVQQYHLGSCPMRSRRMLESRRPLPASVACMRVHSPTDALNTLPIPLCSL